MPDPDRPAAVLTKAQRAYLRGERDYHSSTEMDVRRRIRERAAAAMDDLALLARELSIGDLRRVFYPPKADPSGDAADGEYRDADQSALSALLFAAALPSGYIPGEDEGPLSDDTLTRVADGMAGDVEAGVVDVLRAREGSPPESVSASIEIERAPDDADLADLSPSVLSNLLMSGEISEDEFLEATREKRARGDAAPDGDSAET